MVHYLDSKLFDRLALTTGQAANYCFVSKGTIQNWINSGQLPSQRTAGGQFRIRINQLREFMLENGMSTEALDMDYCISRHCSCWEFFTKVDAHVDEKRDCSACVVKKSQSKRCFELRAHVDPEKVLCKVSCEDCRYYQNLLLSDEEQPKRPSGGFKGEVKD